MHTNTKHSLRIVAIEILEVCNLYCSFCVRNASKNLKGILTNNLLKDILKKLTALQEKPQVALTGGEPLMHKDLPALIHTISEMNFRFSITTNGTIHRIEVLNLLKGNSFFKHFIVSIDSADERIHNQIRQGNNSFQKTIHFIEKIKGRNIPFCINMTVNEDNYRTVTETVRLARDLGAKDISVATVKPNGRGEATLSQEMQNNIVQQLFECSTFAKDGFKILANDVTFFLYDLKNYEQIALSGTNRSCAFGNNSLHIQTNGNILGCTSCSLVLDNIFNIKDNEIEEFWEGNTLLKSIRDKGSLTGVCGTCKYKTYCGGCRCRAYALKGDLFAEDPYCPLVHQNA